MVSSLRQRDCGQQASEIAKALALGAETVRSHIKKAQAKLGGAIAPTPPAKRNART